MEKNVKRVLDLGCGEGKLIPYLIKHNSMDQIVGVDVSLRALKKAKQRIKLEQQSQQLICYIVHCFIEIIGCADLMQRFWSK